jgi:hypothetical protein
MRPAISRFSEPRAPQARTRSAAGSWESRAGSQRPVDFAVLFQINSGLQVEPAPDPQGMDRELVVSWWRLAVFNAFDRLLLDLYLLVGRNIYAGLRPNHQGLRSVSYVELALEG